MKKILVIYYTQSGQLLNILKSVLAPLEKDGDQFSIDYEELKPVPSYPFPWSVLSFFDVQPEAVLEVPTDLEPFGFDPKTDYDLIVLGYQSWFLSPSIPTTSFLLSPEARKVMEGKPVVTINGCRNMWLYAQESIKNRLKNLNAHLILNIPLVDRSPNWASVISVPFWMFTAKKQFFKFLPSAGVSNEDIKNASKFGNVIKDYLAPDNPDLKANLSLDHPAEVEKRFVVVEKSAKRIFRVWARFIRLFGKPGSLTRKPIILIFTIYMFTVISLFFFINKGVFFLIKTFKGKELERRADYFAKNLSD
ncbi:dialkylresorcinol condensing enzyme DarA [bacterium]|nr:dialkylresorcinol condensing enzyme DarA [bacterium]